MKNATLACGNLTRRPVRASLTLLGLALAVTAAGHRIASALEDHRPASISSHVASQAGSFSPVSSYEAGTPRFAATACPGLPPAQTYVLMRIDPGSPAVAVVLIRTDAGLGSQARYAVAPPEESDKRFSRWCRYRQLARCQHGRIGTLTTNLAMDASR